MQGIPAGFALTAITNHLASENVGPAEIGSFAAVVGLPWAVQFFWGPLIDRLQYSRFGHRKHWLVMSQIVAMIASLGLLWVNDPSRQIGLLGTVFFIHSIFASIQDASADAIAIELTPAHQRGRSNAFMRGGFLAGVAVGAAGLSYLLNAYSFRTAAVSQFLALLIFTLLTFFIKLDKSDRLVPVKVSYKAPHELRDNPRLGWLFSEVFKGILAKGSILYFVMVMVVYFSFSVFIRSYAFHLVHVVKWPDEKVSLLQGGWGTIVTLIIILLAGRISDKVGADRMQTTVLLTIGLFLLLVNGFLLTGTAPDIPGVALALWAFADPLFSVASFPILMSLCRKKVEGSQFTAYMSLINFCDVLGSYGAGRLLDFMPAPVIGLCCGLAVLFGALILGRLFRSAGFRAAGEATGRAA